MGSILPRTWPYSTVITTCVEPSTPARHPLKETMGPLTRPRATRTLADQSGALANEPRRMQDERPLTVTLRTNLTRALGFFFQAEDGIRDLTVTGVQTCALPI